MKINPFSKQNNLNNIAKSILFVCFSVEIRKIYAKHLSSTNGPFLDSSTYAQNPFIFYQMQHNNSV